MRNSLDEIAWIEQYLLKQLNREEIKEMEQKIASDADFAQKVAFQQKLMRQIRVKGYKNELENIHSAFLKQKNASSFKRRFGRGSMFLNLLMITGALGLVLLAGYLFVGRKTTFNFPELSFESMSNFESPTNELDSSNHTLPLSVIKDSIIRIQNIKEHQKNIEQYFLINNEDTSITGNQGTILSFKQNSFVFKNDNKAYKGKVKIILKEFYELQDMLWASLNTMSDGHMLETGGMLYIEALDTTGKSLSLIQKMDINMPTNNKMQDMQLFEGDMTSGLINWKLANSDTSILLDRSSKKSEYVKASRWIDMLEKNKYRITYRIEKNKEIKAAYIHDLIPNGFHFQLCDASMKETQTEDSIMLTLKTIPYDSVAYFSYIILRNSINIVNEPQLKSGSTFVYIDDQLKENEVDIIKVNSDKAGLEKSFAKGVKSYSTFDDKFNYKDLCDEKKILEVINQKASCKSFFKSWNAHLVKKADQRNLKGKIKKIDGSINFKIDVNTGKAIKEEIHFNTQTEANDESIGLIKHYMRNLIRTSEFTPHIKNGVILDWVYEFDFNVDLKDGKIVKIATTNPVNMDMSSFAKKDTLFRKVKNDRLNKVINQIQTIVSGVANNQAVRNVNFSEYNYAFTASSLGWINCDRFINTPLVALEIPRKATTMPYLVCHSQSSILSGAFNNKGTVMYKVPKNEKVTLIQQVFNTDMTISFAFQTFYVSEAAYLPEPVFEQMNYEAFAQKVEEIKKQSKAW